MLRTRPVVLATLASRVDPSAERVAVDSAIEAGVPLLLVNAIAMPYAPRAFALGGLDAITLPHEEDYDAVRATANRAAALGIRTELLRVTSPRPARAIAEVANERGAALVVFGPARGRVRRRRLRRAARAVLRGTRCLVWIVGD
ncbi:MAG: Universal stress protein family [Thermoleophilaceae bacterium]|jgi:nucleotide-binding universal stress UspA family protein|nr:Universal stress protein family [Thermoleophilaceae bacterium]